MPLSAEDAKLAEETVNEVRKHAANICQPVRVTPERMAAVQAATRVRINIATGPGQSVLLVEDPEAPVNLQEAIAEACPPPEFGLCSSCKVGRTVRLDGGSMLCLACKYEDTGSKVVLASERSIRKRKN